MDSTDATDRSEQQARITPRLNEAYRRICREKIQLWFTESVTLDANKCFSVSSLSKTFVKIEKITLYQDYSEDAAYAEMTGLPWAQYDDSGTIVVPAASASGTVYVKYQYKPVDLGITYNIRAANTTVSIPVDEAISAAQALALVGKKLYLIDVSLGTYAEYTIASATAGAAGAAAIVVTAAPSTATADGDTIHIGDNWTPVINEDWHNVLILYAIYRYYKSQGPNYIGAANDAKNDYDEAFSYITDDEGEEQELTGAYSPII
jgi:hypothetical protein